MGLIQTEIDKVFKQQILIKKQRPPVESSFVGLPKNREKLTPAIVKKWLKGSAQSRTDMDGNEDQLISAVEQTRVCAKSIKDIIDWEHGKQ